MAATKTYKIRRFTNGKNKEGVPFYNYSLTIPSTIAEKLPRDQYFECVLTEEGILFRAVASEPERIKLPSWATQKNGRSKQGTRKRPGSKTE